MEQGEWEELVRFKNLGVYEYIFRDEATWGPLGKTVKAK